MEELTAVCLTQEELLAALLIATLRAPIGFDDLEARVFGDLPQEMRPVLLAVGERVLLARGLLALDDEDAQLSSALLTILRTCTSPMESWIVSHQPGGGAQRTTYFHRRDQQLIAHVETVGIHQFLHLTDSRELAEMALQLVEPLDDADMTEMSGTLPERSFASFVDGVARPTNAELQDHLVQAGWDRQKAEALASTFERLVSVTALARLTYEPRAAVRQAFTVIRGESSQWIARLTSPEMLQLRRVSGTTVYEAIRSLVA